MSIIYKIVSFFVLILYKLECFILLRKHKNRNRPIQRLYLKSLGVKAGEDIYINGSLYLYKRGSLELGTRVSFGEFTRIWNFSNIKIGNDFLAAANLTLSSGGHNVNTLEPTARQIKIGDRVWVGVNVTILENTIIGNDCVVAAGAVVKGSFPSGSIIGGVPGKVIGKVDLENRENFLWSPWKAD